MVPHDYYQPVPVPALVPPPVRCLLYRWRNPLTRSPHSATGRQAGRQKRKKAKKTHQLTDTVTNKKMTNNEAADQAAAVGGK